MSTDESHMTLVCSQISSSQLAARMNNVQYCQQYLQWHKREWMPRIWLDKVPLTPARGLVGLGLNNMKDTIDTRTV